MTNLSSLLSTNTIASLERLVEPMRSLERAGRRLRAVVVPYESFDSSAALLNRDLNPGFDPVSFMLNVQSGERQQRELTKSALVVQGIAETHARHFSQMSSGISSVSDQFAAFSATMQMAGSDRQAVINAVTPVVQFRASMLSTFATLSFAAQALDNFRNVMIDLPPVVPWKVDLRRLRARRWLTELGSDEDPGSVELVEMDGIDFGEDFRAFWYAFLGEPVDTSLGQEDPHITSVGGVALRLWGVRIYSNDTDCFGEIRVPPWGTGDLDIRQVDPFRPAESQLVLRGLRALGYGARRGRQPLAAIWDQEAFHRAYRHAESVVRSRRAGRRGSQLEVAGELGMSDRHLRRLITLHGLPDE